jgi:hypothetical protein
MIPSAALVFSRGRNRRRRHGVLVERSRGRRRLEALVYWWSLFETNSRRVESHMLGLGLYRLICLRGPTACTIAGRCAVVDIETREATL